MKKKINYKKLTNSIWMSSQFLFVIMGIIIGFTSIILYLIGTNYIEEPELVALIIIVANFFLFIISFIIMKSFEKIAEISKIKSEFITTVSHQLRAPIVNLRWGLSAFEEEDDEEKKKEYIKNLKENVERAAELTEDFFIAAKIQEEDLPYKKEGVFLEEVVKETISRFDIIAEKIGIKINLTLPQKFFSIFLDRSHLKLVVENLLDNAISYSKKGGIIDIFIEYKNDKVYFTIKDTGIGIPKEDERKVFKRFFRSRESIKIKEKGTGLGLFIIKSIIEKEKGKIWFHSVENKGTTFSFFLPLKNDNRYKKIKDIFA